MNNNPLTGILTPAVRRYVYAAYALAGIVLGALQILEVNTGKVPEVLAYLGVVLGATAASNAPSPEPRHVDRNQAGRIALGLVVVVTLLGAVLLLLAPAANANRDTNWPCAGCVTTHR